MEATPSTTSNNGDFYHLLQLFPQCEEWMVRPLTEARDKYEMMKEEQEVKKKEVTSEICFLFRGKLVGIKFAICVA